MSKTRFYILNTVTKVIREAVGSSSQPVFLLKNEIIANWGVIGYNWNSLYNC